MLIPNGQAARPRSLAAPARPPRAARPQERDAHRDLDAARPQELNRIEPPNDEPRTGAYRDLDAAHLLPKPARRRAGSASKPCLRVSTSHGSSMAWRWSRASLVTSRFSVVAVTMEKL